MFLDLYNHLKRLPLPARIIFGLALGAVFIFLFNFIIAYYFSVPIEANYFSNECKLYVRIDGNGEKISKLSNEIAKDYQIDKIINLNNPRFSICNISDDKNLIYIHEKDKTVEEKILREGFSYNKIGKGKYLISKSVELLETRQKQKIASEIFSKYRFDQNIYIYSSKNNLSNSDFKMLSYLCDGENCFLKGKEQDRQIIFVNFNNGFKKIKGEYLNGFDFVYNKVNLNGVCKNNIKEVSEIEMPLWIQLLGMENFENYTCNNYVLAIANNQNGGEDFIWQKYRLLLKIDFKEGLNEERIKDIEYNLKKSVASLFPTVEDVQLKDNSKILEVKIDPDKINFKTTSTYNFLDFPDKSATIYYWVSGNILQITNDMALFSWNFPEVDYMSVNAKLNPSIFGKYLGLFEVVTAKDNVIYLK